MNIWITTDTHFNHKQLIEYGRPKDFEEKIWKGLEVIKNEDMLIHLGDVCIGKDEWSNVTLTKMNSCKKILIMGNHDNKSIKWYLEKGWDIACERLDLKIFGKQICFSHRPTAWDGYFDINLHGHFHDTDHRRLEPEFNNCLSGYNKLIALEYTNYQPITLKSLIS